ncbi:MAG TPA: DUF6263 family protein [Bacillota bacterium]
MKKLTSFFWSALIWFALACGCRVSAEPERILLKQQFQPGQSYNLIELCQFQLEMGEGAYKVTLNSSTGVGYIYSIEKLNPLGEILVKLKLHSFYYESPGLSGSVNSYDSTNPFALPIAGTELFSYLVGDEIKFELDPTGQVRTVRFSDNFFKKVLHYFRSHQVKIERETIEKKLIDAFQAQLQQGRNSPEQGVFPETPVAVGESWEQEIKFENNGISLTQKAIYTLKKRQNGVAYIELDSQGITAQTNTGGGYKFVNLSGGLTGVFAIDEATAWINRYKLQLKLDAKVQAEPAGSPEPDGQSSTIELLPFHLEGTLVRKPGGNN